jgi:lysophospholipase L1-like esterase
LKTLAINLAVFLGLIVIALAAGEAYLRLTIAPSSGGSIYQSTLETKRYKVMKPNASIISWGKEYKTNSLGFRDRRAEVPPKPAGGFRVVVLGDSFTASAGVDFENIYSTLLEKQLQQEIPNAEVLNLSVGGYNLIQEELVLEEDALSLAPDFVLVAAFPFNDLSNDDYRANEESAQGRSKPGPPAPWHTNLWIYQAFLSRVEARVRAWFPGKPNAAPAAPRAAGPSDAEQNLDALTRMAEFAKAHGLPLMIVLLPNTDDFDVQRQQTAPFEEHCRAHELNCLTLLNQFKASGHTPKSMRLNLLDNHPNELYNALVARYVGEWIAPVVARLRHNPA